MGIGKVKYVLNWIEILDRGVVKPIVGLVTIYNVITGNLEFTRVADPSGTTESAACITFSMAEKKSVDWLTKYVEKPALILSCDPNGVGWFSEGYSKWQKTVLDAYNNWMSLNYGAIEDDTFGQSVRQVNLGMYALSGKDAYKGTVQAKSLKDNLVVSTVGLCVPGIIENLDKMGQIQCRYVYCLEKEVPDGIPMEACEELKAQMWCKYTVGPLAGSIPLLDSVRSLFNTLVDDIKDPIGLAMSVIHYICSETCWSSASGKSICSMTRIVTVIVEQWWNIQGAFDFYDTLEGDYCSQIGIDEEKKGK
jgi:hypothetical protein